MRTNHVQANMLQCHQIKTRALVPQLIQITCHHRPWWWWCQVFPFPLLACLPATLDCYCKQPSNVFVIECHPSALVNQYTHSRTRFVQDSVANLGPFLDGLHVPSPPPPLPAQRDWKGLVPVWPRVKLCHGLFVCDQGVLDDAPGF